MFIIRLLYNIFKKENNINSDYIKNTIDEYDIFWDKVKKDTLEIYQKIFALIQYCCLIKRYDNDTISYINCKKIEQNSIISKSIKFYKDFISYLDEESPVFFRLLEINSKFGLHNNNKVFTFNLLNVGDIKNHLESIIPEVIYFFSSKETTINAFTHMYTCEIAINEFYLFKDYKKMELTKNVFYDNNDLENMNSIAMNLSRTIIHEDGGHVKFRNISCNDKSDSNSPSKCIVNGKIKKMTYLANKDNNDELIKIFPLDKKGKGDSGHLLELAFGKFNNDYTVTYFDKLKNKDIFLLYPDYFVKKEKIKYLEEFIYFAYLIEQYNGKLIINQNNRKPLEELIPKLKLKIQKLIFNHKKNIFCKHTEKQMIELLNKKHNIEDKEKQNENNKENSDEEEELALKINKNKNLKNIEEISKKNNKNEEELNECHTMYNINISEEEEDTLNFEAFGIGTEDNNQNFANLKMELTKEEGCESSDEEMVI